MAERRGDLTVLSYMYRDANNYKEFGEFQLAGAITPEQIERLRATLAKPNLFIPTQIGEMHLGVKARERGWVSFPHEDDDHVWHEMFLDAADFRVFEDANVEGCTSVEDFVQKMEQAAKDGWDGTVAVEEVI